MFKVKPIEELEPRTNYGFVVIIIAATVWALVLIVAAWLGMRIAWYLKIGSNRWKAYVY